MAGAGAHDRRERIWHRRRCAAWSMRGRGNLRRRPNPGQCGILRVCGLTAGALAEMSHDVRASSNKGREAARHVGLAWAGLGILRSFPFTARRRIFLRRLPPAASPATADILAGKHRGSPRVVVGGDWSRHHLDTARRIGTTCRPEALHATAPGRARRNSPGAPAGGRFQSDRP